MTIAQLDDDWKKVPGTEKTFDVDTVLIAVGLAEVDEFYNKAKSFNYDVYKAGDAQEIAEASAAMFSGKIEGTKIARSLGFSDLEIPQEWDDKLRILKAKPGPVTEAKNVDLEKGVFPIFHCKQEVPCNPCTSVCPVDAIKTVDDKITGLPYIVDEEKCIGCMSCVAVCPGLAVTLVDYRKDPENPTVTFAYEVWRDQVTEGKEVPVLGENGENLGRFKVKKSFQNPKYPGTYLVSIEMPKKFAKDAAGIWLQEADVEPSEIYEKEPLPDSAIICRCERITAGEIRQAIRDGVRDMNQLKAKTRAMMGACGGKTCRLMIWRIFMEEGVEFEEVTERVDRPLFVEVPLGHFAGVKK